MTDQRPLILDSHLDLSFSALQINRDLKQPAATVRVHDSVQTMEGFGSCTVTLPDLRRGNIGLVCGTVMSRLHRARKGLQKKLIRQAIQMGIVDEAWVAADGGGCGSEAADVTLEIFVRLARIASISAPRLPRLFAVSPKKPCNRVMVLAVPRFIRLQL